MGGSPLTLLRVSQSGQVYQVDLPEIKVSRDREGGYYLHGRGHFIFFETLAEAERKKVELGIFGIRTED